MFVYMYTGCDTGSIQCLINTDPQCIPNTAFCDGTPDCSSGYDEFQGICGGRSYCYNIYWYTKVIL